jgi:hypothetical protein
MMTTKKKTSENVVRKTAGATDKVALYTAVNGNMFTILLGSERLGIRLPEEERAKFLKKYGTTLLEAYGAVMKEYVAVPDGLLRKTRELAGYLDLSFAYTGRLKPKPTAKKR